MRRFLRTHGNAQEGRSYMKYIRQFPMKLIFGRGKIRLVGEQTRALGQHAALITGQESALQTGLLSRILSYFEKNGVQASVLHLSPDEKDPVRRTMKLVQDSRAQVLLALGGGSILDVARHSADRMPDTTLILIPTTCGFGSVFHPVRSSDLVILDSELLMTMPRPLLAATGFDSLSHGVEAVIAGNSTPRIREMSLYGIELLSHHLRVLYDGKCSAESWDAVAYAGVLNGTALIAAGPTACHAMEFPLWERYHARHGKVLAALAPAVYEASTQQAPDQTRMLAQALGGSNASDFIPLLLDLEQNLQLNGRLGDLGIEREQFTELASRCQELCAGALQNNPVLFTHDQLVQLYLASYL